MTYFLTLASPLPPSSLPLPPPHPPTPSFFPFILLLLPVSLPFLSLLSLYSQAQLTPQPQPW